MEAERHRFGGKRIGRIAAGAERLGALEKVNHDFGIGVAEGWRARLEELLRALMNPGEAFLAIACAEFIEEFAETAVERFLDAGHRLRFILPRRHRGHGEGEKTKYQIPNTKRVHLGLKVYKAVHKKRLLLSEQAFFFTSGAGAGMNRRSRTLDAHAASHDHSIKRE